MRIWVDLANSPQVLFFRPLIHEMERSGHQVIVSTRHFAQTIDLADHFGFSHTPVGGHGGRKITKIGGALLERALELLSFARGQRFDLALSHNSYAQALAARVLGIRFVTSMDYEHQPANHICFRLAHRVVVPEFFPSEALGRFGAGGKAVCYHGTKEEIYLADFQPEARYLESIGIAPDKIIAVLRPPGTWGLYHHFENPLFDRAFEHVVQTTGVYVVFLPRVPFQGDAMRERGYPNVVIPPKALDGPNILYHADLVISGGGTMNREAAVLGTPTYSLFRGRLAAVDRYLIEKGHMSHIGSIEGITSISVCKKIANREILRSNDPVQEVTQLLIDGLGD